MSDEQVLASSPAEQLHRSVVTFEVAVQFLEQNGRGEDGWSEPVQFRFEKRGEQWDLVMRHVEKRGAPASMTEHQRAITEMRDAREIHAAWAAGLRDGSIDGNASVKQTVAAGGIAWHEEWVCKYDRVISLLERT